jgi:hypothetical protein
MYDAEQSRSIEPMDWLRERYPEFFADGEPRRGMAQFDVLLCLAYGLGDHRAAAFFTLSSGAATEYAARIHDDPGLKRRVVDAVGMTIDDFDARAPQFLKEAWQFQGGFTTSPATVAKALETGVRDV